MGKSRAKAYAVARPDGKELNLLSGPYPKLSQAKYVTGDPGDVIVRFNADLTDDVILKWVEGGPLYHWVPINE